MTPSFPGTITRGKGLFGTRSGWGSRESQSGLTSPLWSQALARRRPLLKLPERRRHLHSPEGHPRKKAFWTRALPSRQEVERASSGVHLERSLRKRNSLLLAALLLNTKTKKAPLEADLERAPGERDLDLTHSLLLGILR